MKNLDNNLERCRYYLQKYEEKDLEAMNELFDDAISLRDWKIHVRGKKEALAETQKNFENANSLAISILHTHESEDSVAAELKIVVNEVEVLYVVDVIRFSATGLITDIRAYLGRGDAH